MPDNSFASSPYVPRGTQPPIMNSHGQQRYDMYNGQQCFTGAPPVSWSVSAASMPHGSGLQPIDMQPINLDMLSASGQHGIRAGCDGLIDSASKDDLAITQAVFGSETLEEGRDDDVGASMKKRSRPAVTSANGSGDEDSRDQKPATVQQKNRLAQARFRQRQKVRRSSCHQ